MSSDLQKSVTMNQHLNSLQRGEFSRELDQALRDLVQEIELVAPENGGKAKGDITIKLGFKLDKGIYELTGEFKTKVPEKHRAVTHAWATPEGYLSPQNPNQIEMFDARGVRIVPGTGQDIRHA